jgi:hypothetical protein
MVAIVGSIAVLNGISLGVTVEKATAVGGGMGGIWLDSRFAVTEESRLLGRMVCCCGGDGLGGLSVFGSEERHCC